MQKKDFENPFVNGLSSQATKRYKAMSPDMIVAEVLEGRDDMEGMYYLLMERFRPLMNKNIGDVYKNSTVSHYLHDKIFDFWVFLYGAEEPHWGKLRQLRSPKAFGSWLKTTSYRYFLHELEKEESHMEELSEWAVTDTYADDPEERAAEEELDLQTLEKAAEIMAAITLIKNPLEQFAIIAHVKGLSTEDTEAALNAMKREADPTATEVSEGYVYTLRKRAREKIKKIINRENNLPL